MGSRGEGEHLQGSVSKVRLEEGQASGLGTASAYRQASKPRDTIQGGRESCWEGNPPSLAKPRELSRHSGLRP